jgi:hypothetical protein
MPNVLPAEPADGNEWQHQRQGDKEHPGGAFTDLSLEHNEADYQRQHGVHHVAQQQAPLEQFHRGENIADVARGLHYKCGRLGTEDAQSPAAALLLCCDDDTACLSCRRICEGGRMIMKRAFPVLFILLAGCIVQSFHPFYTDKSKVALPQLNGEWDAVTVFGDPVDSSNMPPWQISADQIVAYDPKSPPSNIHVTFFKLGDQLFCDSTAGTTGNNTVPTYWAWHVYPVHTVTKIETNADLLIFKPLDLDWLTNRVATGKVSLSNMPRTEDVSWPLFTAKPAEWEKFLKKYGNSTDAFPSNHIYVLKRHMTTPAK